MQMYDPPSPGEFIKEVYFRPTGLSAGEWVRSLGMPSAILNNILNGSQDINPEIAIMLSQSLGRSPESWLRMQEIYDAWLRRISVAGNIAK
jgi:addiction module HigA family antidote